MIVKRNILYFILLLSIFSLVLSAFFYLTKIFFLANTSLYNLFALFMPFLTLFAFFCCILSFFFKYYLAGNLFLFSFIFAIPSHKEIFSVNLAKDSKSDLKVVSYNVGTFDLDRFFFYDDQETNIVLDTSNVYHQNRWLDSLDADVVCFQEFYNNDFIHAENIIDKMYQLGYTYFYMNPIKTPCFKGYFGVVTFSKHKIIDADSIFMGYNCGFNRGIYTDIMKGKDTIRVINAHLHSMSIRFMGPEEPDSSMLAQIKIIKVKLEKGFKIREGQLKSILTEINSSPHPIVAALDMNDTPFSFCYQSLKSKLKNSFEESGNGFGFTYNKFPWFIRIDNQFYGNGIVATNSKVMYTNEKSDHFPLQVEYKMTDSQSNP
jgi:endonuclease/exonuclease/phosphatase family metal-dependent hydrolase